MANLTNITYVPPVEPSDGDGGGSFFDTYYSLPRFVTETLLAILSLMSNAIAVCVLRYVHGSRHTVYHRLFLSLAAANMLCSVLSWACNNSFFLFEAHLLQLLRKGYTMCDIYIMLLSAELTSSSFGIVSTLTILGFTTVQYYAICKPLYHLAIVRKGRICMYIALTWAVSIIAALIPLVIVISMSTQGECVEHTVSMILGVVIIGADVSIAIVIITYLGTLAMCLRIYCEIRKLQRRLSQFRYEQSVSGEQKAFVTIAILLLTLSIFSIPYSIVFVITLNTNKTVDMTSNALIYYMNTLPYIKYFSDPLIYGMRMREAREGLRRLMVQCGLRKCMGDGPELLTQPASSMQSTTVPAITAV